MVRSNETSVPGVQGTAETEVVQDPSPQGSGAAAIARALASLADAPGFGAFELP